MMNNSQNLIVIKISFLVTLSYFNCKVFHSMPNITPENQLTRYQSKDEINKDNYINANIIRVKLKNINIDILEYFRARK